MWRSTREHFVDKSTQTPPVNRFVMPLPCNDFWRQILWRAAEGKGLSVLCIDPLLRKAEICYLNVPRAVKDNVFRFQISINIRHIRILPVDDAVRMECFNCADYFCRIEASSFLRELHISSQMPEQLASIEKVHDEVQFFICLKSVMQVNNERVLNLLQDFPLS